MTTERDDTPAAPPEETVQAPPRRRMWRVARQSQRARPVPITCRLLAHRRLRLDTNKKMPIVLDRSSERSSSPSVQIQVAEAAGVEASLSITRHRAGLRK